MNYNQLKNAFWKIKIKKIIITNKGTVKNTEQKKIIATPRSIILTQEIKTTALINKSKPIIVKIGEITEIFIAIKSRNNAAIKSSKPSNLTIIKI